MIVAGVAVRTTNDAVSQETVNTTTLEGTVIYRERIMLPPNAEVAVSLENVARMDVAAETIASQRFVAAGGPPYPFSLEYDPTKIDDRGRYVLRARIEVDGRLMFTNDQQIPAFGGERGKPVQVLVKRVGTGRQSEAVPSATLRETHWKLVEMNGASLSPEALNKDMHLVLTQGERRIHGFSGCNRFTGGYEEDEGKLHFAQMASTQMACMSGMEYEQEFLKAMAEVQRYVIADGALSLFSGDERLVLRFEAQETE